MIIMFKCKVMSADNRRLCKSKLMSGEYPYRINIIHTMYPYGLNRIYYQCNNQLTDWEQVKHRTSNYNLNVKRKQLWLMVQCAYI